MNGNDKDVGSTRCIEIDLKGTGMTYNTADNLAVMPENDSNSVIALAKALDYTLDTRYDIHNVSASESEDVHEFPSPFTTRDALTRFFDIHGIPRASIITQLLPYITESSQRDWLRKLVAKDNRPAFKQYMESGGRSVFELLTNELTSCRIPLEDFMHIIPHMQPRYYTISSSSSCYPTSVHITGKLIINVQHHLIWQYMISMKGFLLISTPNTFSPSPSPLLCKRSECHGDVLYVREEGKGTLLRISSESNPSSIKLSRICASFNVQVT